ncbi:16S rRNA (uracil(1498)-N(3))-methyltransferase [Oceanispirochaeta sp.]|uniref:RsmE family RNA methyltransferase n=1 Tax=Oceanispirochaeta sp. TaxID=2035350 RepID=UPI00261C4317|nr:RsmE family RNA methyltransferase [Oceanispirochaeta sp.]MDA3955493.1 RsmE family RNA methyltransferase [Oceanispirochaeta sp.]
MKQLLVAGKLSTGKKETLRAEEFHYLCRVRRSKKGESIELSDSTSTRYSCKISEIMEDCCIIEIGEILERKVRPYSIHLYLCLCKGKKQDLMIRQATEAGSDSITLLDSTYSQVKYVKGSKEDHKYDRWRKIIKEAQQQSGSSVNTILKPFISFQDLPEIQNNRSSGFFCHQEKMGENSLDELKNNCDEIHLVIGSEGGLSTSEIEIMKNKGFSSLYLGESVLRAETASLFALAVLIATMEII